MRNLFDLIGFVLFSGGPVALALFGVLLVVVGVGVALGLSLIERKND